MDFIGTGKRLAQGDIGEAARWLGIETAALLAFIEVEAAGKGFDSQNRPKMLFEPHVFWRELGAGAARDLAARLGVAYPKWGEKPYPKDSYPRLKTAQTVQSTKALRSASWGLGQILADKHALCGHASEEAFVRANMQGEREQLLCMTALMIAWGVPKMIVGKNLAQAESWAGAAAKWNGSGFRKHDYHGRLAKAYVKHSKGEVMLTPDQTPTPVLQHGMKGEAVRNLQNDLVALGYKFPSGIDGRFGDETQVNVLAFQKAQGLTADGKAGPATLKAIAARLAQTAEVVQPLAPEWEGQTTNSKPPIWLIIGAIVVAIAGAGIAFLNGGFNVG